MEAYGVSAVVKRIRPGVVLKRPWDYKTEPFISETALNFAVEPPILRLLGPHPRIVKYLGQYENGPGFLLGEASCGDLQDYIDNHPETNIEQRIEWCRQAAEAVVHIHKCGVIHSDLRPGNILVHETCPGARDLLVCDFGGSMCEKLGLDGGSLPSLPFYHPMFKDEFSTAVDIFSLGSVFYVALTGRWPYRSVPGRPKWNGEREAYEAVVEKRFAEGAYPDDVATLPGGSVIMGCWKRQYTVAQEVLDALEKELGSQGEQ